MSSDIDERSLREIYLPPFEQAVRRAGVMAVMSSYNRLNGTYTSEHHWLLTKVLRQEWGFQGIVMALRSIPFQRIWPWLGEVIPAMARPSVDFPQPLSPTRPTTSPGRMLRLTLSSA